MSEKGRPKHALPQSATRAERNASQSVLVIHGVSNRNEAAFTKTVAALGRRINAAATAGASYRLVPAYWGDLAGGDGANLNDALPPSILAGTFGVRGDAADAQTLAELLMRAPPSAVAHAVRSEDDAARIITDGARARARRDLPIPPPFETRGSAGSAGSATIDDADLARAIAEALRTSTYLRHVRDPSVLDAVGDVVGASLSSSPAATIETRGIVSGIRDTVARVVDAVDNLLGAMTGEALGAVNQAVRSALARATALSLGDIVAYRSTGNGPRIQERILERAWQGGIDTAEPIVVLAHSLGGLVALDMLVARKLCAKRFVTVGSQPAMFHVLKELEALAPYAPGTRTPLPAGIAAWTNLWHPMDTLAFVASPVFVLADGTPPRDVKVDTALSTIVDDRLWMHSAYWESDALVDAIVH